MAFQKFRANHLFDGYRMLDDQFVLVMSREGVVSGIVPLMDAGDDVQSFAGILSPGFVNCHCHLELSHMQGAIPEGTGLIEFVSRVITDRHLAEAEILSAISKAEDEMLANGIVAVGDICNTTLTLHQKTKGRVWYHNFIEASGFLPQLADVRFKQAVEIFQAYAGQYAIPVSSNSIVPHAPYSVSEELWEKILHFPGNQLMSIHNQETNDENDWFMKKQGGFLDFYDRFRMDYDFFSPSGKSSLQTYLQKFLPTQQVILVHNVYTAENDLTYCQSADGLAVYWCLCPNANRYITGHLPNVELLDRHHCNLVLGTDSLASNHQLSILAEMRTLLEHFPFVKKEILFQWGTLNGAKALQMDDILGSFEKGKKPGVVLSDTALTKAKRLL